MLLGVLLPCILLSFSQVRQSPEGLFGCSLLIIPGMVFHRVAVSGLAMTGVIGQGYFPAWSEFALMGGVVSGAALVYLFAVEKLAILECQPLEKEIPLDKGLPKFGPGTQVWLGEPWVAAVKRYSLAFVVAFSLSFLFLPLAPNARQGVEPVPAQKARGGDVLRIDGNADDFLVLFDHKKHEEKMGGQDSCKVCHHLNNPYDQQTECFQCHSDMYLPTSIFDHDLHQTKLGGNHSCVECHPPEENRGKEMVKDCNECHKEKLDLTVPAAPIQVRQYLAPSYTDALHGLCVTCHKEIAEKIHKPEHGTCNTCHRPERLAEREIEWESRKSILSNKWVITTRLLPPEVKLDRYVVETSDE